MKEQTNTKIYQYDGDEHRLSDVGLYFRNLDKPLLIGMRKRLEKTKKGTKTLIKK